MYKKILEFKSTETLRTAGYELPIEVEKTVIMNDDKISFSVRVMREGASYYSAGTGFANADYSLNEGKYKGIDVNDVALISTALVSEAEGLIDSAMGTAARDVEGFVNWLKTCKKVEEL